MGHIGRRVVHTGFFLGGGTEEGDLLEDLSVDVSIILKCIFKI